VDFIAIANSDLVAKMVVRGGVIADPETDDIFVANPQDKAIPLCFTDDDPFELSFNGEPLGSLEIAPKTLVHLTAKDGVIAVEKLVEGAVSAIPSVPCNPLSVATDYSVDGDPMVAKRKKRNRNGVLLDRALYESEIERINTLLK
jgi:hypothetical protein